MLSFEKERNRKVAEKVIKGLQSRNMEGYFVETKDEALGLALDLIPKGSSVSWGGTYSIEEIGLKEALIQGQYTVYNREYEKDARRKAGDDAESPQLRYLLSSTNAITEDGVLVNP